MPRPGQPDDPAAAQLDAALAALRAGRHADAAAICGAVLDRLPAHMGARHCLGLVRLAGGDAAGAVEVLRAVVETQPRNAVALANLGLALLESGSPTPAAEALTRAVSLAPAHVDGWYNLGLARQATAEWDAARTAFGRALALDATHAQALAALASLELRAGRPAAALETLDAASGSMPESGVLALARSDARRDLGDLDGALADALAALGLDADRAEALARISALNRRLARTDDAVRYARQAVDAGPNSPVAWRALGMALRAGGDAVGACAAFERCLALGRAPGSSIDPGLPTFALTSLAKLAHDAEQFDWLAGRRVDSTHDWAELAATYRSVHDAAEARLAGSAPGQLFSLAAADIARIGATYNRVLWREPPARVDDGALSIGDRREAIENDYASRGPGITWIDEFLSGPALAALRAFCLDATIWFDFNHNNGYLGAYFDDGFGSPLLLQIAEELRAALPGIFADHPLLQAWAYKYDSTRAGIDLHADFAAVNVNFWLTPDTANLDPASGGLRVFDVEAPAGQAFDEYNSSEPQAQARIRRYLKRRGAAELVVPYRANRAVVFNSDLFHRTDTIRFRPGYENRRINVTMLFGRRESAS